MPILLFFALLCLSACKPALLEPEVKASAEGIQEVLIAGTTEPGYRDGPAQQAQFAMISDLAFDNEQGFYILDSFNRVLRYVSNSGYVSTFAGKIYSYSTDTTEQEPCRYSDGHLLEAYFCSPISLAGPNQGSLYILDSGNRRIRKVDLKNKVISSVYEDSDQFFSDIEMLETNLKSGLFIAGSSGVQKYDLSTSLTEGFSPLSIEQIKIDSQNQLWFIPYSRDKIIILSLNDKKENIIGQSGSPEQGAFHCVDFPGPEWSCSGGYQDGPLDQALFHDISSVAFTPDGRHIFLVSKSRPKTLDDTGEANVLRRIDLHAQKVETIMPLRGVDRIYISPQGAFYFVRQHQLYQLKPSPAEVTE